METSGQTVRQTRQAGWQKDVNKAYSLVGGRTDNKRDREADGQEVRVRQASCRPMGRQPNTYFTFSVYFTLWVIKRIKIKLFGMLFIIYIYMCVCVCVCVCVCGLSLNHYNCRKYF
jgi:hypothetical protein